MYLIILMHALFGSSIPISKVLLNFSTPIFLAGIRMVVAGVLLLGYKYLRAYTDLYINKKHLWLYLQIIVVGVYLKYVLRYWSLNYMSSGKLAFLLNIGPFVAALFSYYAFNERLSFKQWLGLIIGFVGIIPMLLTTSTAEQLLGEIAFISWPELVLFIAVACHCYGMIVSRKLIKDNNHSPVMVNGVRMLGGGLLALPTAFIIEGFMPVNNVPLFIGWLAVLILISNIICHNLYLNLLKYYTVTFISLTDCLSPLFSALYGWLFLHEVITWHYYVSGIIIFLGLYLFYQDELRSVSTISP